MIEVAAAMIEDKEGRILIARRKKGKSQAGLWEFPGGKLEPGESGEMCLQRELREEMQIEIHPYAYAGAHEHDYGTFRIRLHAYKAIFAGGTIVLMDHDDYRWAACEELESFLFAPADVPFVKQLVQECRSKQNAPPDPALYTPLDADE